MADRGPLNVPQTRELRAACRANAERLVSDSISLFQGGRFPSAFNLAYFALEELAKARALLVLELLLIDGDPVDWKDFWDKWESHPTKSVSVFAMEGIDGHMVKTRVMTMLVASAAAQLRAKAQELREQRESALYVDWTGNALSMPATAVTESIARGLVERARGRCLVHDGLESLAAEDPAKARELFLHRVTTIAVEVPPDEAAAGEPRW
jgi:AbiV family abortive infection protein